MYVLYICLLAITPCATSRNSLANSYRDIGTLTTCTKLNSPLAQPIMHVMCPSSHRPPSKKILNLSLPESPHLRESGFREIFACGIRNPENLSCGIWNPRFWNPKYSSRDLTNAWNPVFYWQRIRSPLPGIRTLWCGIQNLRLSWIHLHGAIGR